MHVQVKVIILTILVWFVRFNWEGPRSLDYIRHCLEANLTSQLCIVWRSTWRHKSERGSSLEILTVAPHKLGNMLEAEASWDQLQNVVELRFLINSDCIRQELLRFILDNFECLHGNITGLGLMFIVQHILHNEFNDPFFNRVRCIAIQIRFFLKNTSSLDCSKNALKAYGSKSLRVFDRNILFPFETAVVLHVLLHVGPVKLGGVLVIFCLLLTPQVGLRWKHFTPKRLTKTAYSHFHFLRFLFLLVTFNP